MYTLPVFPGSERNAIPPNVPGGGKAPWSTEPMFAAMKGVASDKIANELRDSSLSQK